VATRVAISSDPHPSPSRSWGTPNTWICIAVITILLLLLVLIEVHIRNSMIHRSALAQMLRVAQTLGEVGNCTLQCRS
jgi:hypothetical protein